MTEKRIKKIKEIKAWFKDYKSTFRCTKCGEKDIRCLDFHHIKERRNRKKKLTVSRMVCIGKNRNAILDEIKKCIVLCANCHAKEERSIDLSLKNKSQLQKMLLKHKQTAGGCLFCKIKDLRVLTYHHIEPEKKKFNIGQAIKLRKSKMEIMEELEKTVLICLNCHRKEHN